MSVYYNPDTYRKIIRNGEECWVYDWGKNADINSFNYMLDRWGGIQQKFFINGETRQYFLIDKQECTVMEISNPEVIRFLYEHLYMANINETFIELFTSIGGFKTVKYEQILIFFLGMSFRRHPFLYNCFQFGYTNLRGFYLHSHFNSV